MLSQSVTDLTEDPGLPTLAQVLNTQWMLQVLAQAVRLHLEDETGLSCTPQVLNHKLGRRCTIRYTLTCTGEEGQPRNLVTVIGKLYGKQEQAERLYRRTHDLSRRSFNNNGPLRVPAPLMLVPELGLVLQEHVEGVKLRHVLSAHNYDGLLSLVGSWIATLHVASPLAGLKTTSLQQELGQIDQWCEYVAPHLSTAHAERLRQAQEALHRTAGETPPCESVMIHKDFYYGNVLWDGQRVWGIDFDALSIGDPALDVGHFLAHLEILAYRMTGRNDAFAQSAASFLRSYQAKTSLNLESRLPFYRAYTFLKLAATKVRRKQDQWQRLTQMLAALACRELDRQLASADLGELEGSGVQA